MKIWTNNGEEEVVLCDHGRGGPSNFVPQVVRNKDVLTFVQGEFAKPKARGNTYRTWTFTIQTEHDSQKDAEQYLIELHTLVPLQADVDVELSDGETRYLLPECVIEFSASAPVGVLTTVAWTLTFGGIKPIPAQTVLADEDGVTISFGGEQWVSTEGVSGELI
ncbi:hypothetical protein EGM51_10625 [Verrucomicrobia bacterium S94]|nr:hypothetical protein EGM51_10625 [Verrucomicrobia bacterium S94]